ncbi:MAG: hypothetical protein H7A49_03895 [Akkermansiaceae bacterium]|nr:hypothetical protein [Akkermansiaceae bacterium]MCP5543031.1 hypothetical protein [Akkermansiaceae bacterium]
MLSVLAWNLESVLLVLLVLLALRIMMQLRGIRVRVARVEQMLVDRGSMNGERTDSESEGATDDAASSGSGAFEEFLAEDPARREMPKSERFAAYRKWRKDKGLNWSQS